MAVSPAKAAKLAREKRNRDALLGGIGLTLKEIIAEQKAQRDRDMEALNKELLALKQRVDTVERSK